MPHIDSAKFGKVKIDGKEYNQVLIIGNRVMERDYEKLKKLFDTSHKIGDWEIEELLKENPEIIVVATGQDGLLEVEKELIEKMSAQGGPATGGRGIEVISAKTPEAIEIYNEKIKAGKRVNALIHTTC